MAAHAHASPHGHAHEHADARGQRNSRRLLVVLGLTSVYLVAEVIGGLLTGSLALLADAGHMASDAGSVALALGALWLARRPATARRTFGYLRAEILAALANATALCVVAVLVFLEALERFRDPPDVLAGPMLAVATGGLLVNLVSAGVLHAGKDESLNVRGAFLHVVGDALGSVGAIASAAAIWAFDWRWADPAASCAIAVLVLLSAFGLLRETLGVLMQMTPARLDMDEITDAMRSVEGVCSVHDVHAWTVTSGREVLSAHVVIEAPAPGQAILEQLQRLLRERFSLWHVTLQLEHMPDGEGCVFDDCV